MKSLHLATPDDADKLLPLVQAFHNERGSTGDPETQAEALGPLLEGSPHGAVWLVGPRRAPVGYIAVTFGWSLDEGGLEGEIAELYIRPAVRRRGMGFEALNSIAKALKEAGIRALHLQVTAQDADLQRFYERARFKPRADCVHLSRAL